MDHIINYMSQCQDIVDAQPMVATDRRGALNWASGDDATWIKTIHPKIISKGKKIMGVPT